MTRWSIVLVATLMAATGSMPAQLPAGEVVRVITDYELPPPTLDEAWSMTAVIVRVRVEQSQPVHLRITPLTEHTMTVLEVFKGADIAPGQQIRVFQDSVDDAVPGPKHTSGGPVFAPTEEYVLFLDRAALSGTLHVSWGASGALSMMAETVAVKAATRMWGRRPDVPRAEVLDTLRALRETRR
jgi:hypothetical protein